MLQLNVSLSSNSYHPLIPFTTHPRLTTSYSISYHQSIPIIASNSIGTASCPTPPRTGPRNSPSSPRKSLRSSPAPPHTSTTCESESYPPSPTSAPSHRSLSAGSRCGSISPCSSGRKSTEPCIRVSSPNLRSISCPIFWGWCCQSRRSFPV